MKDDVHIYILKIHLKEKERSAVATGGSSREGKTSINFKREGMENTKLGCVRKEGWGHVMEALLIPVLIKQLISLFLVQCHLNMRGEQ